MIALLVVSCVISTGLSAQSADDVIKDYLSAIGGKSKLNKITSMKMKAEISSDMFEGNAVITVLNGKGFKLDLDVMGMQIETCFTDTEGWSTDPMAGSVVDMPEEQYKMGKGAIYIAGPYDSYKDLGYTAELVGRADIGGVNTYQVRLNMDGTDMSTDHFFDPDSHLLIRTVAVVENQGMEMETVTDYKDYKEVDGGIKVAHIQEVDYGGQMSMTNKTVSVEVNVPVDPAIFEKK